jgi:CBS domain-containing protein
VDAAVNEYFLKYGYGGFPVVEGGNFLGFLTLKDIRNVRKERWKETRVSEIFTPHDKRWELSQNESAIKSLELMISEDTGRLPVMEEGNVIGLITRNGIARYVKTMGEINKGR